MFKSAATAFILRGVLALAVGVIAIAWPGVTVLVLAALFAAFAFVEAALPGVRAFGGALIARPGAGAVTFAQLFRLFALIYGTSQVIRGVEARGRKQVPGAVRPRARVA